MISWTMRRSTRRGERFARGESTTRAETAARVDDFHAFLVNDLNGRREPGFQCLVAALMSVQCLDKVALRAFERLRERVPDGEVTAEAIESCRSARSRRRVRR